MPLTPSESVKLKSFIRRAVRLPHARLEEIQTHQQTADQQAHQSTVSELFQASRNAREDAAELAAFTEAAAEEAQFELGESEGRYLAPQFVASVVSPCVRALLIRDVLEDNAIDKRKRAFTELTAQFSEILPS